MKPCMCALLCPARSRVVPLVYASCASVYPRESYPMGVPDAIDDKLFSEVGAGRKVVDTRREDKKVANAAVSLLCRLCLFCRAQ